MRFIPQYSYYKSKHDRELLIDVVELNYIKTFVATKSKHTLTYYDITFISEGSGFFTIDEQTFLVKFHDVVFTKPGDVRNWDNKGIKKGFALIFDEEFMLSFFNDPDFLQNLSFFAIGKYSIKTSLDDETYLRVSSLIMRIKGELTRPETKDKHTIRNLIYETLTLLNRAYINENHVLPVLPDEIKNVKNHYVNEFLRMVSTEYNRQHSIRYYSDKLDITPNYLNEMVKKSIGMNAKQYIQNKITLEAKRILAYTDLPVTAIADSLCFENTSYFIRFFRTQTNYTPMQYRNLVKDNS
ncbi:transcriptional regulator [Bacteroidia bacterium]|nr:transcriptional regulator [Bacteroidia bacterium]